MAAMPVLKPLHEDAGLNRLVVSTYHQAVSGAGLGVQELADQVARAARPIWRNSPTTARPWSCRLRPSSPAPSPSTSWLKAGNFVDDGSGETDEEQKLRNESRKILGIADPGIRHLRAGPGVHRPQPFHLAEFDRPITVARARALLQDAPV